MTTNITNLVDTLEADLIDIVGPRNVSSIIPNREKASLDGASMSPILREQLPLGLADLVVHPSNAEEIAATVAAAVRHGVSITPRGKGTGNYGQAIPLHNGLVIDMSKCRTIVEVGNGYLTAEAGATMIALEQAAREKGQQLLMYPSTAQSTIGGFLAGGSSGTGPVKNGLNSDGELVRALDVVHGLPTAELVHVEGNDAQPYVHTYEPLGC